MADQSIDPTQDSQETQAADQTAEEQKAGATGSFNAGTQIAGMADLKNKAPKLYDAMMKGIAFRVIHEMKKHNEKLKEIERKSRRQ